MTTKSVFLAIFAAVCIALFILPSSMYRPAMVLIAFLALAGMHISVHGFRETLK